MKKNVASQLIGAQMTTAADGTAFTGTATVVITIDGGTQSASGGTGPTHEGNGYHTYIPTQAETNGGIIAFTFTGAGAITTTVQVFTTFPQTGDSYVAIGTDGTGLTEAGGTGDHLTAINLPNQTMDITGTLSGTVGGIAGTITTLDSLDTAQDTQHTTTQAAVGAIGTTGGAALPVEATSDNAGGAIIDSVTILGTEAGTYANTEADDTSLHVITGTATALDWVYGFTLGGGYVASAVAWKGYVNSNHDDITVQAWNGSTWDTRFTIAGQTGTTESLETIPLLSKHTTAAGLVYIRFVTSGDTNPVLGTNVLSVQKVNTSRTVGYANGEVWIDTVSGVAGTESFVNGVADNPVDLIASALTIATNVNLRKFWVGNGSTITLAATLANKVMEGHEWTLALGGQSVAGSMFIDAAVSGTGTGAEAEFEDCIFAITSLPAMQAYNCSFTATTSGGFTMSAAGDYRFINCQSGVAGSGAPLFTLGTGAITAEFRRWSGGITLAGITADDVLTISGELGTVDLGSPSGAADIQIRGTYKAITNVGSATVNVTGAILAADVAAILVDTGTTIPATITTAQADLDIITGASGVNLLTATQASIDAIEVDTGTTLPGLIGTPAADLAADIAAVKAKVDLLPENPAKNTQFVYVIKMVDSTDHVTPKTTLTVGFTRSIDGAAFGAATGTVAEIATGHYKVTASTDDMNGDVVAHRFTGTAADDLTIVIQTTA